MLNLSKHPWIHCGIPTSPRTGELTVDTHRVYNDSEIIVSMLPNLKGPPPKGGSCTSFLMILVVIAVAAVA
jgi:hypothetical protein